MMAGENTWESNCCAYGSTANVMRSRIFPVLYQIFLINSQITCLVLESGCVSTRADGGVVCPLSSVFGTLRDAEGMTGCLTKKPSQALYDFNLLKEIHIKKLLYIFFNS